MPVGSEQLSTARARWPIAGSPSASALPRAQSLERFFKKIKHCRRIASRYDKLAANYLAFVQLASIRVWLTT
jgi:transposase